MLEAQDAFTFSYVQKALIQEEQRMKGESESNVSLDTGGEGVAQGSRLTKGRDTRRYVSFVGKLVTFVRIIQAIGRILPSMKKM